MTTTSGGATSGRATRIHDLDALRAVAMMLGLVIHAGIFVLPDSMFQTMLRDDVSSLEGSGLLQLLLPESSFYYTIQDKTVGEDRFYEVVLALIHGFRMPVFFLLSGFFSALLWQRRSLRTLAMYRLKRVGLPFAIGCLTIVPLVTWLLSLGSLSQREVPLAAYPFLWLFHLAHLWFLWYLLILAAVFIIVIRQGVRFEHPVVWWLTIPLSLAAAMLMNEAVFGADASIHLVPNPGSLAYFAMFFAFGAFMYQRGITVRGWWIVSLLPAVPCYILAMRFLDQYAAQAGGHVENAYVFRNSVTIVAAVFETAFAWLTTFGLMGLFRIIASKERFWVRYMSDASYWIYLAHLPLVIVCQLVIVDWPIHYHLKFLLICAVVTLVTLVTYQFAVRYTIVGVTLNGPRSRRQLRGAGAPS